jgi:hypothetical protein
MQLQDFRMHDGSRQFATFPESEPWSILRDHIATLEGATVTDFITDNVTEAWIDFEFANHRFTVNNQSGEYWFIVDNPSCKDETLEQVARHCNRLLGTRWHNSTPCVRTLLIATTLIAVVLGLVVWSIR